MVSPPIESVAIDRADAVRQALAGVMDPEIPAVTVFDLGIVREISADGRRVTITPTYSGCPATAAIEADIRQALAAADLAETKVAVRLDPAWTTDWITPEGREKLLAYGIAPPSPRADRGLPALRLARHRGGERLRLDAVQGAVALPRLRRAVRPLQVPLT